MSIGESHTFLGKPINGGGLGFARGMGDVTDAHVVGENENDVWLLCCRRYKRQDTRSKSEDGAFHGDIDVFDWGLLSEVRRLLL